MAILATVKCMGKGTYFSGQIHHNEIYLIQYCHLPPTKGGVYCGPETLLDNETILHNVWKNLAIQNLGTITPLQLHKHVNNVIFSCIGSVREVYVIRQPLFGLKIWAVPAKCQEPVIAQRTEEEA